MARIKLTDLFEGVESALLALGSSRKVVRSYRSLGFQSLQHFFEENGCLYYSKSLADKFVSITLDNYKKQLVSRSRNTSIRKVAAMLDEYKNTGAIKWRILPKYNAPSSVCKYFENVLTQYLSDNKERYASSTLRDHGYVAKQFLHYLEERGHRKFCRLTRKIINDYIPIVAKRQPGRMSIVIPVLKSFLGYLHENKYISSEFISALPGHPIKRKKHFVGLTREEANTLIRSVPFGTHYDKRNIAIFTLAENTGLRAIDVVNLKLNDIDWRNKTISIIQHKTKHPLILPFENRVGDALAEYILNGRPDSDIPFIFLSAQRPFRPISPRALSIAASKYIKLSNIGNSPFFRKGFHCFRRSIGTWLLEAELPLTMISEILGHGHINSSKPYISTDLEGLRECAIGLEGIEIQKKFR